MPTPKATPIDLPDSLAERLAAAEAILAQRDNWSTLLTSAISETSDLLGQKENLQHTLGALETEALTGGSVTPADISAVKADITKTERGLTTRARAIKGLKEKLSAGTGELEALLRDLESDCVGFVSRVETDFMRRYQAAAEAFGKVLSEGAELIRVLNCEIAMPPPDGKIIGACIDPAARRVADALGAIRTGLAEAEAFRAEHTRQSQSRPSAGFVGLTETTAFKILRDTRVAGIAFNQGSLINTAMLPIFIIERLDRMRLIARV